MFNFVASYLIWGMCYDTKIYKYIDFHFFIHSFDMSLYSLENLNLSPVHREPSCKAKPSEAKRRKSIHSETTVTAPL